MEPLSTQPLLRFPTEGLLFFFFFKAIDVFEGWCAKVSRESWLSWKLTLDFKLAKVPDCSLFKIWFECYGSFVMCGFFFLHGEGRVKVVNYSSCVLWRNRYIIKLSSWTILNVQLSGIRYVHTTTFHLQNCISMYIFNFKVYIHWTIIPYYPASGNHCSLSILTVISTPYECKHETVAFLCLSYFRVPWCNCMNLNPSLFKGCIIFHCL